MSYKIRNSIALGVILFLILGVDIFFRAFSIPRQLSKVDAEITRIDKELQHTPNLIHQFNELSATLGDTKKRWEQRNKEIPPVDITSQTYSHFSRLIDQSGDVKLDMVYAGAQQRGQYGYNVYNLKGEGQFENLYRFIWYLENGRKLYKVNNLSLKGLEIAPTDRDAGKQLTTFEMTVHAFYSSVSSLGNPLGETKSSPNTLVQDPFAAVISAGLQPNTRGLVEVERSDLKAVIPGKAFLVDQNTQFRTLAEGDEVYLGYVTRLVPDEGRMECTLNKGGIVEKVELQIRYGARNAQQNASQKPN